MHVILFLGILLIGSFAITSTLDAAAVARGRGRRDVVAFAYLWFVVLLTAVVWGELALIANGLDS